MSGQDRIDAAAARLLGRAQSSDTDKGLAKDLHTVLDALTVAQGRAVLSQPTPPADQQVQYDNGEWSRTVEAATPPTEGTK